MKKTTKKVDTKNTGSSESQISILSEKINRLSSHFAKNKNIILDSPGQLASHYCPNAPVYILNI